MAKNDLLHLLKERRFLSLFFTQFTGAFNDNLFRMGLITLVIYQAEGLSTSARETIVTVALGLFMLPFFLFSATAGQLADKFSKTRLVQCLKGAELAVMTLAAIGFIFKMPYFLLAMLFLRGIESAFFGPVKYSILPAQLKEEELVAANGLIGAGTFIAILLGTILGGNLISIPEHGPLILAITVVSVGIIGLLVSFLILPTPPVEPDLPIRYNIFTETARIITTARENERVFLAILGISWFWLVGATFMSQLPNLAKDILNVTQGVYTFMLTSFSIGIGIGAMLCNRLLKGEVSNRYVPVAALLITGFIALFAHLVDAPAPGITQTFGEFISSRHGIEISLSLLFVSISAGLYIVPLYSFMQARSAPAFRSRIVAANNILNALFMVVSSVITMILLQFIELPTLFMLVAAVTGLVALYICQLLPDTVIKTALRTVLKVCFRVKVSGLEHYGQAGKRVLIIANHQSFLDAMLLATFLPEKVTFAINTHIARLWWIRPFLTLVKAFPLDPTNPMATKALIDLLKQDEKVVIFPEGRITVTGSLMKVYDGPGLIADKSGATLLPVRIEGAQYSRFSRMKSMMRLHWFPRISLTVLPPCSFDLPNDIKGRKRRQLAGTKLYDTMSTMMFDSSDYHQPLFASILSARTLHGPCHIVAEDIQRQPLTYNRLITGCYVMGEKIAARTEQGDYLGIMLPNALGTLVTFFAMHAYGRVPAMLNFSTGIKNLLHACHVATIKQVYTSKRFIDAAKMQDTVDKLTEAGIEIIYLEDIRASISLADKLTGLWKSRCGKPPVAIDANDPAVVLFTSGSEGTPKGVVLSHTNIQANRCQLAARLDFGPKDIVFNALPMFHSFGLTGGTLLPLLSGAKTFFYPSPLHYRIVPEMVYETNSTILFGTDTFLQGYARYAHHYDFRSLRFVFAGAEKLKPETRKTWMDKFGVRIFEGYGITETSPVIAVNTPLQNKSGTVGRIMPGITYKLEPIPGIDDGGELLVKGPNVMLGYLLNDNPGQIVPLTTEYYSTGDIIELDENGYVTIKGRAKRFAKIGGEMISLTAVEHTISTLWPNIPHAVVSVPDAKKGEQLVLITEKQDAEREAISQHFRKDGMTELAVPRKIITVEKLPMLATGKVDYVTVKEMAMGE